jgi:CheY-like chemotaxis protein
MVKTLKKILFVDDDEDILTIAKFCLIGLTDISIKYVNSGEKAIQEALQFQPDLILLDVMMPKMDGVATYKAIRLLPTLSLIPIAFVTAKVQKEEIESYLKLGVVDVISKPFNPLTLPETVLQIWTSYSKQNPDS